MPFRNLRLEGLGNLGDLSATSTVNGILGARVVGIELLTHLEDLVSKGVEVDHLAGEPRGRLGQISYVSVRI